MFASPQKVKKGVKIYAIMEFTVLKSPKAYATHIYAYDHACWGGSGIHLIEGGGGEGNCLP